jgi:hypothetical protein
MNVLTISDPRRQEGISLGSSSWSSSKLRSIGNTRVEVHARADLLLFGVHMKDEALARPRLDTRSRRGRDRIRSLGILLVLEFVCATDKDVRRVWMRAKLDRISR